MKFSTAILGLAGASSAALAAPAWAQTSQESSAAASPMDIIVTARRRDESMQDVPQVVNAVGAESIEKLNLQRFEDIQTVVPGLTLTAANNGVSSSLTLRGATFESLGSASPTVEFYTNDALMFPTFVFKSLFDVGQVEVLRGPQGTLRGRASPSGSITVQTRRPDLSEVGGYLNVTATNKDALNINGAINIPLINDKVGLRLSGITDKNDFDFARSINSNVKPSSETEGGRISLRVEPSDAISANVMYQVVSRDLVYFTQVESISLSQPTISPGTSQIIHGSDRMGISEEPNKVSETQRTLTANVEARFAGQRLSFVGARLWWKYASLEPQDFANAFPGEDLVRTLNTDFKTWTAEGRLSSDDRLFGMLDYTVGVFHSYFAGPNNLVSPNAITIDGSFLGAAPGPILVAVANANIGTNGHQDETSFFGNLTAHVADNTEISGGLRYINFKNNVSLTINGGTLLDLDTKHKPVVYNFSVSHRFSDSLLAYANTGSSWRSGPYTIGVFRSPTPNLTRFTALEPEKSKSYEVGIKSDLFDRKLRLNLAAFYQKFDGFIYRGPPVTYVNISSTGTEVPAQFNFQANVPATIKGLELDATFQPSKRLSINAGLAYSKGRIKNGVVACNDLNGDGVPDGGTPTIAQIKAASNGDAVAACSVSRRLSTEPNLTFTVQPEYNLPLSDRADGFVRGLLSYYGHNSGSPTNPYDTVKAYGILNLFLGVRAPDNGWELSLFAKNITNTGRVLQRGDQAIFTSIQALQPPTFTSPIGGSATSAYVSSRYTSPREFGINLRVAFGSR
ncbi:TonB-dependent receptor [Sphingobium tyrosinilyticum]|uniref:TonB-dependent receptor n=1 Tax=Sphingobium tyrosinilyticum TaxID=2715436 RepID=A0ABV9EXY5_9SPHN